MNNLASTILSAACNRSSDTFIECEETALSGAGFGRLAVQRAQQLRDENLKPGDCVIVATGRGNAYWSDLVAVWSLGLTAVPVHHDADEQFIATVERKTSPRVLLGELKQTTNVCTLPEPISLSGEVPTCIDVDSEALALIVFTSGSTGSPKGVALSHRALHANIRGAGAAIPYRPGERVFMAVPFRFISAISHFLVTVDQSGVLLGTEAMRLKADYIRVINDSRATATGGSPIQAGWIAEGAASAEINLRWIMSSGDHLPVPTIERLRAELPDTQVFTVYGITEVGGRLCILPAEEIDRHAGSVGKPIAGMSLAILQENGDPVAEGDEGEIYVRGDCLFSGYYNDAEITASCLDEKGFRTGDLGRRGADGWVYHRGRVDDVFKSAGLKVSTVPIEQALKKSGMFSDVAVLPEPHPFYGQAPAAYYVESNQGSFNKPQLMRFLRQNLPANHIPASFRAVDAVPRTGSGKVARAVLRAMTENKGAA